MKQRKPFLILAALLGMITVMLGAFGAHKLKAILEPSQMENYQTAIDYLMYHALFLLAVNQFQFVADNMIRWINCLTLVGVLFFSGSIILISLEWAEASKIWFITPLGGSLLIVSWGLLAYAIFKGRLSSSD